MILMTVALNIRVMIALQRLIDVENTCVLLDLSWMDSGQDKSIEEEWEPFVGKTKQVLQISVEQDELDSWNEIMKFFKKKTREEGETDGNLWNGALAPIKCVSMLKIYLSVVCISVKIGLPTGFRG